MADFRMIRSINSWRPTEVNDLPNTGTVHVWLADLDDFDDTAAALAVEATRAQRFVRPDDRRRFLAGRALVRTVLSSYLGCPPIDVTLALTTFGKPYSCRRDGPDLRFNLSHSGSLVALAVSVGVEVGIDIETAAPPHPGELAPIVLSERELRAFDMLPPALRPSAFLRCWTRKEALLKAAGTGLYCDPRMLAVGWEAVRGRPIMMPDGGTDFAVADFAVEAGATGSVAIAAPAMAVETRTYVPIARVRPPEVTS
jgi:4'-phosphopantetheinyl transferase